MSEQISLLRLHEVESRTGLKKASIYALMNRGEFPAPVKLVKNGRAVGWPSSAIDRYIAERMGSSA